MSISTGRCLEVWGPPVSAGKHPAPHVESIALSSTPSSPFVGIIESVSLETFVRDFQVRYQQIDPEHVAELVNARRSGASFPVLVAFRSEVGFLYLADGHHRAEALTQLGETSAETLVIRGEWQDALFYAMRLDRGLPRSTKDKQFCLEVLLNDEEWSKKTNYFLAGLAGVDPKTVQAARVRLGLENGPRVTADNRVLRPRQAPTKTTQASSESSKPRQETRASDASLPATPVRPLGSVAKTGEIPNRSLHEKPRPPTAQTPPPSTDVLAVVAKEVEVIPEFLVSLPLDGSASNVTIGDVQYALRATIAEAGVVVIAGRGILSQVDAQSST